MAVVDSTSKKLVIEYELKLNINTLSTEFGGLERSNRSGR